MWIFTETGFISIVRKPEQPELLTVRARDRQSLEALATKAGVDIKRSPKGDYPYRVFVGDEPFLEWFLDRGSELQYPNFKSRIAKTRGYDWAHALGMVWSAMLQVEDAEARDLDSYLAASAADEEVDQLVVEDISDQTLEADFADEEDY